MKRVSRGELMVHDQPMVDLTNGGLQAYEALLAQDQRKKEAEIDIFIPPGCTAGALDGDLVEVRLRGDRRLSRRAADGSAAVGHPVLEEGLRTALRQLSAQLPKCRESDLAACEPIGATALE